MDATSPSECVFLSSSPFILCQYKIDMQVLHTLCNIYLFILNIYTLYKSGQRHTDGTI